jgi:hypothetical protein
MALSLKQKIALLDNATGVLDEMVQDTDLLLPKESKHITDRLNGVVDDMKGIVECLRQKGLFDEELIEILEPSSI